MRLTDLVYDLHKVVEKVNTLSVVLLQKHFFFIKVCLTEVKMLEQEIKTISNRNADHRF